MTQHQQILSRIEQLRVANQAFCVATIMRTADATSAKAGAKALVIPDGTLEGYVGGGCVVRAVKAAALECLRVGQPRVIRVKPAADINADSKEDDADLYASGCPSGGSVDVFLEPMLASPRVIICGSSPVALALVNIVQAVGLRTEQVQFDNLRDESCELAALDLQEVDSAVVVTQGTNDRQALLGALRSPCKYVGMVGSRRKIAVLKKQLVDVIPAERLESLRGPAGLDIGAIAPEEIALSIVAELVAFRRMQLPQPVSSTP